MSWFLGYLALCSVCVLICVALLLTAPVGWEDEEGFHLGEKEGE